MGRQCDDFLYMIMEKVEALEAQIQETASY